MYPTPDLRMPHGERNNSLVGDHVKRSILPASTPTQQRTVLPAVRSSGPTPRRYGSGGRATTVRHGTQNITRSGGLGGVTAGDGPAGRLA